MEQLRELLSYHDFYYEYSDDFRVWQSGHNRAIEIRDLMSDLGFSDEVKVLYNEYAPDKFKFEIK